MVYMYNMSGIVLVRRPRWHYDIILYAMYPYTGTYTAAMQLVSDTYMINVQRECASAGKFPTIFKQYNNIIQWRYGVF